MYIYTVCCIEILVACGNPILLGGMAAGVGGLIGGVLFQHLVCLVQTMTWRGNDPRLQLCMPLPLPLCTYLH